MTLTESIIALATIAIDQRRQLAAQAATIAELSARLQSVEASATITLPPELVNAIGQAAKPTEGEGGTVVPPAIL